MKLAIEKTPISAKTPNRIFSPRFNAIYNHSATSTSIQLKNKNPAHENAARGMQQLQTSST
jgi:hypothetical protein